MLKVVIIEVGESDCTSPTILVEATVKDSLKLIYYGRLKNIQTKYFPFPNIEERVDNF